MSDFDTSKLENTGWRLFQRQMKEWYHHEFKELPDDYKDKAIEYVIENNAKIFTKDFVLAENLCHKCGICCVEIGCPDFDKESKLCTKHNDQNSLMCYEYPWSEVGMVLTYNCGYQRDIFHKHMDLYFSKVIELYEAAYDNMERDDGQKEKEE